MNERIRELAIETCDQIEWDGPNTPIESFTFTPEKLEKFAKLIVQECVNVLHDNELWNRHISHALKEHFGVEE